MMNVTAWCEHDRLPSMFLLQMGACRHDATGGMLRTEGTSVAKRPRHVWRAAGVAQ